MPIQIFKIYCINISKGSKINKVINIMSKNDQKICRYNKEKQLEKLLI